MKRLLVNFCMLVLACSISNADEQWQPEMAVQHVQALQRTRMLNLDDFAISPHLTIPRKAQLTAKMGDLLMPKVRKEFTFKLKDSRSEDGLAMAVLEISSSRDPLFVAIQTVAYCRVGKKWLPAPLWSSFEMTGIGGFDPGVHSKRKALEAWGEERASSLQNQLQEERRDAFFVNVKKSADKPELKKDRESAVLYFIEQVRADNMYVAAACLGLDLLYAKPDSSDEMRQPLYSLIFGMHDLSCETWASLRKGNYLMAPMAKLKGNEDLVSIALFFPTSRQREQIFEFQTRKEGDRYVVILPDTMKMNEGGNFDYGEYSEWRLQEVNRQRRHKIISAIIAELQAVGNGDLAQFNQQTKKILAAGDFKSWCELVDWSGLKEGQRRLRFFAVMEIWQGIRKHSSPEIYEVQQIIEADKAIMSFITVPSLSPQAYKLYHWVFRSVGGKWYWLPEVSPEDSNILPQKLVAQYKQSMSTLKQMSLKKLCASVEMVDPAMAYKPMGEDAKNKLIASYRSYRSALMKYDLPQIFTHTACVENGEQDLLLALGSELRGAHDRKSSYQEIAAFTAGSAGGVMVCQTFKQTGEKEYFLFLGFMGKKAICLLPQVLYYYPHGRGQEILNKQMQQESLPKMGEIYSKDALKVISEFNKAVATKVMQDTSKSGSRLRSPAPSR